MTSEEKTGKFYNQYYAINEKMLARRLALAGKLRCSGVAEEDGEFINIDLAPDTGGCLYRVAKEHVEIFETNETISCFDGLERKVSIILVDPCAQAIMLQVVSMQEAIESNDTRFEPERLSNSSRGASERYQVQAAPGPLWLPWTVIGSYLGTATFRVKVTPIGSTVVRGEVRYFAQNGNQKVESFVEEVTVRTGNSIANLEIRLQGTPFGSSCWVDVN